MADRYFVMEDIEGRWLYDTLTDTKILRCPSNGTYSPELVFAQLLNHIDYYYTRHGED